MTADSKANQNVRHAEGSEIRPKTITTLALASMHMMMTVGETVIIQIKDLEERQTMPAVLNRQTLPSRRNTLHLWPIWLMSMIWT